MDLTVEVMLPPRGAVDFSQSANSRYRVMAPIAVYLMQVPPSVNMPCTGYIHVTGVPARPGWAILSNEEILRRINSVVCASNAQFKGDERRLWCGDHTLMTGGGKANLLANRQITVTWTQAKHVLRRLADYAALTDEDLE